MNVGQRIKKRRKELGYNVDRLADMIGKNRATIYRYESNDIENMPYDVIEPLANALQVSPAFLMGWDDKSAPVVRETAYPYVASGIAAGLPESVEAITEETSITVPDSIMGKYAGQQDIKMMRINGESMDRVIPDKSLIAVKRTALCNIKDGDIVVYNDNYQYAVKRMYRAGDKVIFRPDSHNPAYTDYVTEADENLQIVGKVVIYIVELD